MDGDDVSIAEFPSRVAIEKYSLSQLFSPQALQKAAIAQLGGETRIIEILRLGRCGLRQQFADQSENELDAFGIDLQGSFHRLRLGVIA